MRIFLFLLVFLTTGACYYDSEEYLFPAINNSCDTVDISYTNSIQPIIDSYCYGCHSNTNAPQFGSNLKLEDYSDLKLRADDGSLLGTLIHESGYSPMPKGGGKLDDCSIELVRVWIENGALEN